MKKSLPFLGFLDVQDKAFRVVVLYVPVAAFVGSLALNLLVYGKGASKSLADSVFLTLFLCFVGFVEEVFRQKRSS